MIDWLKENAIILIGVLFCSAACSVILEKLTDIASALRSIADSIDKK